MHHSFAAYFITKPPVAAQKFERHGAYHSFIVRNPSAHVLPAAPTRQLPSDRPPALRQLPSFEAALLLQFYLLSWRSRQA